MVISEDSSEAGRADLLGSRIGEAMPRAASPRTSMRVDWMCMVADCRRLELKLNGRIEGFVDMGCWKAWLVEKMRDRLENWECSEWDERAFIELPSP